MCASWPDRVSKTPFAVTLSMTLGDFIDVLEQNGLASLAQPPSPRDGTGTANGFEHSTTHFPLELTPPGPIALPPIPQDGRGRPAALTNECARKIIAAACTGASTPVCAAAGGVTPNTLKSWLRRKDHEAFTLFQQYYGEALTYATLAALKTITEQVASHPKHAFEFLARRYSDHWSKVVR